MSKSRSKAAKFDVAGIIKKSRVIQEIVDPELGRICYVTLTFNDMKELRKLTDPSENSAYMLYLMLLPANPGLTVETIKLLPWDVTVRLMTVLLPKNTFLKPTQLAKASDPANCQGSREVNKSIDSESTATTEAVGFTKFFEA